MSEAGDPVTATVVRGSRVGRGGRGRIGFLPWSILPCWLPCWWLDSSDSLELESDLRPPFLLIFLSDSLDILFRVIFRGEPSMSFFKIASEISSFPSEDSDDDSESAEGEADSGKRPSGDTSWRWGPPKARWGCAERPFSLDGSPPNGPLSWILNDWTAAHQLSVTNVSTT